MTPDRQFSRLICGAQQAAGVIAARHRGDDRGAARLLDAFPDRAALTDGFVLLADMSLQMHCERAGQTMTECVQELCLHLDEVLAAPPGNSDG